MRCECNNDYGYYDLTSEMCVFACPPGREWENQTWTSQEWNPFTNSILGSCVDCAAGRYSDYDSLVCDESPAGRCVSLNKMSTVACITSEDQTDGY